MKPLEIDIVRDKGLSLYLAVLFFYSVIFIGIAIQRYENFLIRDTADLLLFEQFIYNTLHGRPFYATGIGNQFTYHNSPILAALVPFAAVISTPYVLYASTVFSIAVSSIPIYLLSREGMKSEKLAFILGISYIMLPVFIGQIYGSFHEINLVLPFLTFTFYYFVKERFYPFVMMFILGLTVKEDVSLTLFMFSIYAIIKKREMKWYLFPAVLSISWLLFSLKVVIPFFSKSHDYPMISYFSHLGSSFNEIIKNTLFYPENTLRRLSSLENLFYLFILFSPLGLILPLFSVEAIFSMPSLIINMMAESSRFNYAIAKTPWGVTFIPRHMSLMAATFLFISAIYSIKRISSLFGRYAALTATILSFTILVMVLYNNKALFSHRAYNRSPEEIATVKSVKKILAQIPVRATAKADRDIVPHLYDRREVYTSGSAVDADYLVLMGIFYSPGGLLVNRDGSPLNANIEEKYDLVAIEKGVALFKMKNQ